MNRAQLVSFAAQSVFVTLLCVAAIMAPLPWQRAVAVLSAVAWAYCLGLFDPEGIDLDGNDDDDFREDGA